MNLNNNDSKMPYQNVTCHHGIYKQEQNVRGDSFEKKNSMSGGQLILNLWTWMSSGSLFCLVRAMGIKQLTDMYHMTSELFVYANNSLSCSIYSHTTLINLGMFGVYRFDAILPPETVRRFFPSISIFINCCFVDFGICICVAKIQHGVYLPKNSFE